MADPVQHQHETQVFPVPEHILKSTRCDRARYEDMYRRSVEDAEGFWAEEGKRLDWIKPYSIVKNTSFEGDVSIRWFEDGTLNASVNCIDRHLPHKANDVALIWEGDNPAYHFSITYQQLYNHVCRFANILKRMGVKRGDRVTIYMPMIPETAMPCWPAPALVPSIPWCSAGFQPMRWRGASMIATATGS